MCTARIAALPPPAPQSDPLPPFSQATAPTSVVTGEQPSSGSNINSGADAPNTTSPPIGEQGQQAAAMESSSPPVVPAVETPGIMKPDIVFFGESKQRYVDVELTIGQCRLAVHTEPVV